MTNEQIKRIKPLLKKLIMEVRNELTEDTGRFKKGKCEIIEDDDQYMLRFNSKTLLDGVSRQDLIEIYSAIAGNFNL